MKRSLVALAVLLCIGAGTLLAAIGYLDGRGIGPRRLAAFVAQRQATSDSVVGSLIQTSLRAAEHTMPVAPDFSDWPVGAGAAPTVASTASLTVADIAQLRAAMAQAEPGAVIVLQPGDYRIDGAPLVASRAGRADAPITVRGGAGVRLAVNVTEGFSVAAPYWRFEQLTVDGVCGRPSNCEHAFHVVGQAHHFVAVGNTVRDFNAHFKINGSGGAFPDHGLIEYNTLSNRAVRVTGSPVTPIDLVAASDWTIRANLISDFIKRGGDDDVSYGAFAKGGGSANRFERNVVWCEQALRGQPGYRVGLSFGGGGTGARYCRDGKCIVEQSESVMTANLVAACSDDGVYMNNAAHSRVAGNWVLGTSGVSARFAGTSADIEDNVIDGPIRRRDGALVRESGNRSGNFDGTAPTDYQAQSRRR